MAQEGQTTRLPPPNGFPLNLTNTDHTASICEAGIQMSDLIMNREIVYFWLKSKLLLFFYQLFFGVSVLQQGGTLISFFDQRETNLRLDL